MSTVRVTQSSLGSWFVATTTPFHVLHIYPQSMWVQAKDAAFEFAATVRTEPTA